LNTEDAEITEDFYSSLFTDFHFFAARSGGDECAASAVGQARRKRLGAPGGRALPALPREKANINL
jgi:hypothetical protein